MKVQSLVEEVGHDVPNFDHKDHSIIVNHLELDDNNQQEFGTEGH